MRLSRRRLLAAAFCVPAAALTARAAVAVAALTRVVVSPDAAGTSATRCAQCGSPDHTMLDPRCPLAPRVSA